MSEAADAERVTIAAVPEQVEAGPRVRDRGARRVLSLQRPGGALGQPELVTNSVRHSGSAVPGGLVTVAVTVSAGGVRVEVTDRSGDSAPGLLPAAFADGDAEGRRGLGLVDELAARWGYQRGGGLTTTWFELVLD